jgi:pSer/pThr/pTyr-binding forkhead associated (FHA) protein
MTGVTLLALRVLMALVVYAFLAFAVYQFWRELRRQAQGLSAPAIPRLSLSEISLDEDPAVTPRRFHLAEPEATLGRDSTCEISLDDPTISARHTRLSYHHSQWWVDDLQSTNGTFLNGQPVSVAVVLASGDEMRCGARVFIVAIEETA